MALKMTIQSDIGQEFQNAYIRIDEYRCDTNENISARVRAYISRDLMKNGANFIGGSEDIISLKGDYSDLAINIKKQIYEYMKTLAKYSNAIDILE